MHVNHSKAIWSDKVLCRTKNWKRASYTEEVTCKRCVAIADKFGAADYPDGE